MEWNVMFYVNSVLLGVGLAMDAFSVSLVNGLNEPRMSRRRQALIAGTFAFFQWLMPMVGWLCVRTVVHYFLTFQIFVPWIALGLLLYIGGTMLWEGLHCVDCDENHHAVTGWGLFVQGVATSVDALSVGFTIDEYGFVKAMAAALIIAAVTYGICAVGLLLGRRIGTKLSGKAAILGGVILIGIGLEIFFGGKL